MISESVRLEARGGGGGKGVEGAPGGVGLLPHEHCKQEKGSGFSYIQENNWKAVAKRATKGSRRKGPTNDK
jgi:hypothetical protein